jgi:orotate phosphoribosyltransferase-like protein
VSAHLNHRLALCQRAVHFADRGWTMEQIAGELAINHSTAHRYVHAGWLLAKVGGHPSEEVVGAALSLVSLTGVAERDRRLSGLGSRALKALIVAWDSDLRDARKAGTR